MEKIDKIDYGIELCFLDRRKEKIKITSCLYSPKEEKELYYKINKEERKIALGKYTKINDTYRYIFSFDFDLSLLDGKVEIDLGNRVRTGNFFPFEFSLNGYFLIDGSIAYNEGSLLIFEPYKKELEKARRKKYRKSLFVFEKDCLVALAIRFLNKLLKPFRKKDLWLFSDRLDSAGDNAQALFEYAVNNAPKNVKCVFLLDKKSKDYKKMKKVGQVKSPNSAFYKVYYTLASIHLSSQLDGTRLLKIRKYLKDILNKQKTVFLQHGVTKDDISSYYNRFDFGMDLFCCVTNEEYNSIINEENYGCDEEVAKLCGFARYDKLTNEEEKIIFISPSWRLSLLNDTESKDIIEGFENSDYFKFYNGLIHNERLINKALEKGYKLCFYPHSMLKKADGLFHISSSVFIPSSLYSYTEMFKKGALLVTDYSSVQFDFAYLKKPIIYCHFDKNEFFSSHTYKKGYFDYERDGFGNICYTVEDTVDMICSYIDNSCTLEEKYKNRIEKTFKYTDKSNCERILKEIINLQEKK